MAGLYFHIPFCKRICYYCDFYFSLNLGNKAELLQCMLREMELRAAFLQGERIETIYFGGGTPSVLSIDEIEMLLAKAQQLFVVIDGAEITLEANPDDLTDDYLTQLRQTPINRLSIGIQSLTDRHLELMNRRHTANQARECVERVRAAGFQNLTIDLMYGLPDQSLVLWKDTLQEVLRWQVPHISAYHLTIEERTAFRKFEKEARFTLPSEDESLALFECLVETLAAAGYEQYEISNFALPGQYSRHNTAYWQQKHYLGIGPSAHSFYGSVREWNVANNLKYIAALKNNQLAAEREELDAVTRFNEYLLVSLRTQWGCSLEYIDLHFAEFKSQLLKSLQALIENGLAYIDQNFVKLSKKGIFVADKITSDLFVV